MASSLHKEWSSVVRLLPLSETSTHVLFPFIRRVLSDVEILRISVQVLCTDTNRLNVHLFKLFSPDGKALQPCVPHLADATRPLILLLYLRSIRNN